MSSQGTVNDAVGDDDDDDNDTTAANQLNPCLGRALFTADVLTLAVFVEFTRIICICYKHAFLSTT